jgi:hypothetical protein
VHLVKKPVLVLVVVSVLFASSAVHAASCKFQHDSVDKFTKVRTLWTRWDPMESFFGDLGDRSMDTAAGFASAWYEADEISLRIKIELTGLSDLEPPSYELEDTIVVPEGARLLIMMADETIVTLFSAEEVRVNSAVTPPETGMNITSSFEIEAEADIRYALDGEAIAALTRQGATNIRVEAADTQYDVAIHKKSFGDITKAIECIQAAL